MDGASALIFGMELWLGTGALVAVVFLLWGIDRLDADAQGAYLFRPLLIPGILLIWPLVLWRWWALAKARDVAQTRYSPNRRAHSRVAYVLPVVLAATFLLGLSVRQHWPADIAPVQVSTP